MPIKKPVMIGTRRGAEQFKKWAIKYIQPYLLPPSEKLTWNDYHVDTVYGPLGITITDNNVFTRFRLYPYPPPESGMRINPHSGKYNLLLMSDWSVDLCREQFKEHLDRALPVPPDKTIGSLMLILKKHKISPSAIGIMLAAGWIRPELAHMVIQRGLPE